MSKYETSSIGTIVMTNQRLIEVVPYDPAWPELFNIEAPLIKNALGDNCIAVYHIGSTSVLGLPAKPVIDILPVVRDIMLVDHVTQAMNQLGYEAKGEYGILFRRYFQKGVTIRSHQVHVFEDNNPEIERHLKFCAWMRQHEDDRNAYAKLKQELAQQHPHDIDSYCFGKDEFIANINRKTGHSGLRIVKALTNREWDAACNFRQNYFLRQQITNDPDTWTFEHQDHVHFILYKDTDIVGYMHIQLCPNHIAVIQMMMIAELHHNRDVGEKFSVLAERWLNQQGFTMIQTKNS